MATDNNTLMARSVGEHLLTSGDATGTPDHYGHVFVDMLQHVVWTNLNTTWMEICQKMCGGIYFSDQTGMLSLTANTWALIDTSYTYTASELVGVDHSTNGRLGIGTGVGGIYMATGSADIKYAGTSNIVVDFGISIGGAAPAAYTTFSSYMYNNVFSPFSFSVNGIKSISDSSYLALAVRSSATVSDVSIVNARLNIMKIK